MSKLIRIAMWSGPRNISTAMMRSFGNRSDTHVTDEPLYASYLARTGFEHPGREKILASQSQDWEQVFETLLDRVPGGKPIWYQKHMAHHLPENVDGIAWEQFRHAFLIRQPVEMLASLVRVVGHPTVEQTGLPQQLRIFRLMVDKGHPTPPVINSRDVLEYPETMLRKLCRQLDIEFFPEMLNWPPGIRETDGVWAEYWYGSVAKSTGFDSYQPKSEGVSDSLQGVLAECQEIFDELMEHRIRPDE